MREFITQACKELQLESEVELIQPHRWRSILERIITTRTTLSRAGLKRLWLWENLREPRAGAALEDTFSALTTLLPPNEPVWFIAEDENLPPKREGNFWLYATTTDVFLRLLPELIYFEYYIVARNCEWLICENHHGVLYAGGEPMASRLKELARLEAEQQPSARRTPKTAKSARRR